MMQAYWAQCAGEWSFCCHSQMMNADKRKKKGKKLSSRDSSSKEKDIVVLTEAEQERRRLKKLERRAAKAKKHLEELGLDENGEPLDNFSLLKYPVREWKFTVPGSAQHIAINPVVTLIGVCFIWGIVVWNTGTSTTSL
jgi:hypothetical protein